MTARRAARRQVLGPLVLALALVGAACSGDGGDADAPRAPASPAAEPSVEGPGYAPGVEPGAGGGPYVVTAVDYHFHDAHPSLPIALDQELVFANESGNPHTVTFVDVDFDRRLRPGERLEVGAAADLFPGPGRYPFYCRFHADRGMAGVIVVG